MAPRRPFLLCREAVAVVLALALALALPGPTLAWDSSAALTELQPRRRLRDEGARDVGTFIAVLVATIAPCLACCLCAHCLCRREYSSLPPRASSGQSAVATAATAAAAAATKEHSPPAFVQVRTPERVEPQLV